MVPCLAIANRPCTGPPKRSGLRWFCAYAHEHQESPPSSEPLVLQPCMCWVVKKSFKSTFRQSPTEISTKSCRVLARRPRSPIHPRPTLSPAGRCRCWGEAASQLRTSLQLRAARKRSPGVFVRPQLPRSLSPHLQVWRPRASGPQAGILGVHAMTASRPPPAVQA